MIYIFDLEVFSDDWVAVFRNPDSKHHIVIHNDNAHIREFISQPDLILGGFNNKHYDNWILLTMILGGSNAEVKLHNDYIIGGGNGWQYSFVQYKRKPFAAFDLRDDIADKGLSLKAIEGNLGLPIVESSVPFDIDRPLTPEELAEVIKYCKHDVDATVELYHARREYIESKRIVAEMYNLPIGKALGMTNAKLAAEVLEAKYTDRDDEREYFYPDNIRIDLIPQVILDFFNQIHDKTIPDSELFKTSLDVMFNGCPVTYAWGGVHGAILNYIDEESDEYVIKNKDVASLYPNSMLNFGYVSRSTQDPEAYRNIVTTRIGYKKAGDEGKANALKLVVNTTYGAMLNQNNPLYDAWAGRSVCISNQLAMTDLVVLLLQSCPSFKIVNFNTDGIMYKIHRSEIERSERIFEEWQRRTGFELENDDVKKIIQKDVNNYIEIKHDGKIKAKGGYVNLFKGGDFKTNKLVIIHKAIVNYFIHGIPVEETINTAENILDFQIIAKTGSTYDRAVHYVDGQPVEIQKVNRIYATKNTRYGQIKKQKLVHRKTVKGKIVKYDPPLLQEDTLSDCPEHCIIDNENVLTLDDIDKSYYIDMAKKRIKDYTTPKKAKKKKVEVIEIMATEPKTKNIYAKLIEARQRFLEAPVKKSGINRFAEYKYFELADIVPVATAIFKDLGLVFYVSFTADTAVGTLVNVENPEEQIDFFSPMKDLEVKGMNAVQALGGTETYQRRYLYMTCLDIVEADAFDATQGKPDPETGKSEAPKTNRPASPEKRQEAKKELINEGGEATEVQIKSIKKGLKKLRETNAEMNEGYVTEIVKKIKAGLKKAEADDILIEIGEKIEAYASFAEGAKG